MDLKKLTNNDLDSLLKRVQEEIDDRKKHVYVELAQNWDKNTVWSRLIVPFTEGNLNEFPYGTACSMISAAILAQKPDRSESEIHEFICELEAVCEMSEEDPESRAVHDKEQNVAEWFNSFFES